MAVWALLNVANGVLAVSPSLLSLPLPTGGAGAT
jgi:hypothetical protein